MNNKAMLKWAGVVTVLLVFSRVSGFLREAAIAHRFGASAETDAYLIAAMLPYILFYAFNDAVKTAFIPVYGEYHKQDDGNAFALTAYIILGGILLLASVGLILVAPVVVRLVAPGFSGETFDITVQMAKIMLPGLFFLGMSGLSSGLLHTKRNFVIPALPAYPSNAIVIVAAIFFGVRYGIMGLAWATIVGFASQFLIQVPAVMRHGVFKRHKLLWRHPGIKKMAVLLPPVILGGAALELKSIVDRVFGSLLPEGSIAALNFANRVYLLPNGILILALLTVLYPTLVELHVEGKMKDFKETLRQGLGLIIVLVFPMMVGLIVLRVPVVRLLFERGAFDVGATESTAFALAFYSLGLVALGTQLLINRAFYALKDTVTPMVFTFVMVLLNIVLNWFLIKPLAHGGIALGTALSVNIGTLGLGYLLWKKIGAFGGRQLLATFWKSSLAALVMGALLTVGSGYLTAEGFTRQAMELGVLIGVGAGVYFLLAYAFRVEELQVGIGIVRRKLGRP
ncbi:MAG: murein biosynthesis integral membrane protein MurJ [Clostridiales bacterium]|jgi:putative peptidoglycan lipid II flippase|nr:murein biosynthesis integral membrane protein MurJ [Clostridiales bacterium]